MASTTYNRYASIADPTPATALTTPAFNILPWANGISVQLKSQSVSSPVMMPNGASAGDSNTSYWVEGTYAGQLCRDPSIDNVFQSIMMGAFATKVLVPGSTEKPVCYEKTFFDGANTFFRQARGGQHSKVDIKWDADGIVDFSSDFVAINDARATTIITGATYVPPSTTKKLTGTDVTVTIGALSTSQLKKGSFSIEMARKQQSVCGTTACAGIGTSGYRKVNYSFTFYKRDFSFETAILPNSPLAVSLSIGGVNTGYKFDSAAVSFDSPQDEDDDSGQMITITGTAGYDGTALNDIKITQL